MRFERLHLPSLAAIAAVLACHCALAQTKAPDCGSIATNLSNHLDQLDAVTFNVAENPSCFAEVAAPYGLMPARASLITALLNFSNGQQQGSSLSSGSSSNAVSKPSGPAAVAEEFGGLNSTAGTSSTTFQFSPGSLLLNLALTGVKPICDSALTTGCTRPGAYKFFNGLTFKATMNTATGSQSLTGTPMTSTTGSSTAVPVTITSKGSSEPSFGGFTVQYAYKRTNPPSAAKVSGASGAMAVPAEYITEIKASNVLINALKHCDYYVNSWQGAAKLQVQAALHQNQTNATVLEPIITRQYQDLAKELFSSGTCPDVLPAFEKFFQKELEAEAYEDYNSVNLTSKVPAVALEYDLNTPLNQPSYSSLKASGTLQWGLKATKRPAASAPQTCATPNPGPLDVWVCDTANLILGANKTGSGASGAKTSSTAGKLTPPWSLNAMLSVDIYNTAPPSTVPSGTNLRDIQAGAELDYLLALSQSTNPVAKLFGNLTLGGAFLYQDQTSPSILKGIPSNITFTGLPSNTTSVYAVRGPIQLGQVRFGFGTGSKVSFPIAATFSNRTELVTKPTFGLHFGISYNFTSLFTSPATKSASGNAGQ
jgi:hypothetical protein